MFVCDDFPSLAELTIPRAVNSIASSIVVGVCSVIGRPSEMVSVTTQQRSHVECNEPEVLNSHIARAVVSRLFHMKQKLKRAGGCVQFEYT